MTENLEGRTLSEETLLRIEETAKKIADSMKPLTDAARNSSRLTAADYNIVINARPYYNP